jgi:hypothetical protein
MIETDYKIGTQLKIELPSDDINGIEVLQEAVNSAVKRDVLTLDEYADRVFTIGDISRLSAMIFLENNNFADLFATRYPPLTRWQRLCRWPRRIRQRLLNIWAAIKGYEIDWDSQ